MTIKILALAGSTRTASFNKKLVKVAAEGARMAGATVTNLDLRDLPLPLFDEDLEGQCKETQSSLHRPSRVSDCLS
jgi:chromate reductase, NAD(P)H dehydrogenase (quinone)